MKDLHVYDTSNLISAGMPYQLNRGIIEDNTRYRPRALEVGGVRYVLRTLQEVYIGHEDEVDVLYCFDRVPEHKRALHQELFPHGKGYKGNRPKKKIEIPMQRNMAEEILKLCNVNTLAVEGYEADDVIASVCKYYKDSYKHIYIHTVDSDLAYLVNDSVSVVPLSENSKNGKWITRSNWEYTVKASKHEVLPYNSLLLDKLYLGESGDNIPACSDTMRNKLKAGISPKLYPHFCDSSLLRVAVEKYSENDPMTMGLIDLLIPIILPEEYVPMFEEEFKKSLFKEFAIAFKIYEYRNCISANLDVVEELIERYLAEYYA